MTARRVLCALAVSVAAHTAFLLWVAGRAIDWCAAHECNPPDPEEVNHV